VTAAKDPDVWASDLALAQRAVAGDAEALTEVCHQVQDPVFALAMRFTSDPDAAADATQDVLVQVITSLSTYQGTARLTSWAWTIAVRHLRRGPRGPVEASVAGPDEYASWLDTHLTDAGAPSPEDAATFAALCSEVRLACTSGMLLTLSRDARLSYILGDLFELSAEEAADILEITPAAHRQRLARARARVRPIIARRCGLAVADAACSCARQVVPSLEAGILDRERLSLTAATDLDPGTLPTVLVEQAAGELDAAEALAAVFRTDPHWRAPDRILHELRTRMPTLLAET
jgi:RNA polymerase sigma factor (sigma-70 family)